MPIKNVLISSQIQSLKIKFSLSPIPSSFFWLSGLWYHPYPFILIFICKTLSPKSFNLWRAYGLVESIKSARRVYPVIMCVCAKSLQSCPTFCDPMDCSPPGSCVHWILQARILDWVAMLFSRGSSQPRDQTHVSYVSCTGRQVLYH